MHKILDGLKGVVCLMDDVLVFGANKSDHDERLRRVMELLQEANVTLNSDKCQLETSTAKFLDHIIDQNGIRADPEKVQAICRLDAPQSVSELRRFLGMVNQLGKFSPRIAELSKPLREHDQEVAFQKIKDDLVKPTILSLYDPSAPVKASADASSFGLGAVLLQQDDKWKPVAYASRSMSDTETRYAHIEKEALALTWACCKFSDYLLGRDFLIETDHKPLVSLFNYKHLDSLPPPVYCASVLRWQDLTIQSIIFRANFCMQQMRPHFR